MGFIGSLAIGVASGLFTALFLKWARLGAGASEEEHYYFNVPEIGVALILAYLPFLIGQALDLSGIVAVMFAGISMRHYAHYNMTVVTRQVFLPTIELIASLAETYVFLLLGLGVFLLRNNYSASLILWSTAFCLIGRAMHVYPFSWVINRCSSGHTLNANEQHVVWYAGLRGAIAFMCALSFPQNDKTRPAQHRGIFLCTTVVIVGLSLVFLGWPTTAVLRFLNIKKYDDSRIEATENGEAAAEEEQNGEDAGESTWFKKFVDKRGSDFHQKMKAILMTSDAIAQREYNSQVASALRSSRHSSAFFQRPSAALPRPSGAVDGHPNPTAGTGDTPAGNISINQASAREGSLQPGVHALGLPPQLGLPLGSGYGRPSVPGIGYGRPSVPGLAQGRPSAPAGLTGYDQAISMPLVMTGRPSAPPRLQGQQGSAASAGVATRSFRMLCNP